MNEPKKLIFVYNSDRREYFLLQVVLEPLFVLMLWQKGQYLIDKLVTLCVLVDMDLSKQLKYEVYVEDFLFLLNLIMKKFPIFALIVSVLVMI